jgi:hypothetical protein
MFGNSHGTSFAFLNEKSIIPILALGLLTPLKQHSLWTSNYRTDESDIAVVHSFDTTYRPRSSYF